MNEKTFYIILTDTGTFLNRMIKLYTRKPYNHVSISLGDSLQEVYSFGRKRQRNPFIGGFVKENMDAGIFKHGRCAIYSCKATEQEMIKMRDFIHTIEKDKHLYHYNFLGLLAIALNRKIQREHAYFCSQFIATVLQEGGITNFEKPLSFVTPYDLIDTLNIDLLYEGTLAEFQNEQYSSIDIPIGYLKHS